MKAVETVLVLGIGFWIGKEYSKKKTVVIQDFAKPICLPLPPKDPPSVCGKFNKKTQSFAT